MASVSPFYLQRCVFSWCASHNLPKPLIKQAMCLLPDTKIAGCACAGNATLPPTSKETASWRSRYASCVTHVPWCMLRLLNCGGGENAPGIPGASTTHNLTYLVTGPWIKWIDHTGAGFFYSTFYIWVHPLSLYLATFLVFNMWLQDVSRCNNAWAQQHGLFLSDHLKVDPVSTNIWTHSKNILTCNLTKIVQLSI